MKHVLWFVTDVCNYRCPYCDVHQPGTVKPIDGSWIDYFAPDILDISGGEPFLVPNMVGVLAALSGRFAITTNLSQDMTRFVQEISPQKAVVVTCSYHPTQTTIDRFIGKVLMLKNRGFNVQVNVVAYPEQMWLIPELKYTFESIGVGIHVDPYRQHASRPYAYTYVEDQLIYSLTPQDREHLLNADVPRYVLCSAGTDHIVVDAQYRIYRCLSDKLYRPEIVLGDARDRTYAVSKVKCTLGNSCCGCDRDHCTIEDIK